MARKLSFAGATTGIVLQVAYVVADLHKAIEFYQKKLGAGPFFVIDHGKSPSRMFRGKSFLPKPAWEWASPATSMSS